MRAITDKIKEYILIYKIEKVIISVFEITTIYKANISELMESQFYYFVTII